MASPCKISDVPLLSENPNKPEVWFAMMDSFFRAYGITCPIRKYHFTVCTLHVQGETNLIEDLLLCPPPDEDVIKYYDEKKLDLLRRLCSPRLKLRLEQEEMGDRRPSEFLQYLREMCGDGLNDEDIKKCWAKQLPEPLKEAMDIVVDDMRLETLGTLADSIFELMSESPPTSPVSTDENWVLA